VLLYRAPRFRDHARMLRLPIWEGVDDWRAEVARVDLHAGGIQATGTQIGAGYRLDYELDASAGWITRHLRVSVTAPDSERAVLLEHDGEGEWLHDGEPGPALTGALDCDLGLSPLTNLMPVRRHDLHEQAGAAEISTAWVSVPDLSVHVSRQRYDHVRPGVVRFTDLGLHEGFSADLELDADGLVLLYPELARAVTPAAWRARRSPS
jgi:hypothetical protein